MSGTSVQIPLKLLMGFIDESSQRLAILRKLLKQLDVSQDCIDGLNAIKRDLSALRDNAAFFGLAHTRKIAIRTERLLKAGVEKKMVITQGHINLAMSSLEMMSTMLDNIRAGKSECTEKETFQRLVEKLASACKGDFCPDAPLWSSILERLDKIKSELQPKIGKRSITDSLARELCRTVEAVIEDCRKLSAGLT